MYIAALSRLLNDRQFRRFAVVGLVGFMVDAGFLTWLMGLNQGLMLSRLVSFSCAVTVTWLLNRHWSFQSSQPRHGRRSYFTYMGIQVAGAAINLALFAGLVWAWPFWQAWPVVPLALAAGVSLLFNFLASRRLAFRASLT